MVDYLELRLFPKEGVEFLSTLSEPVVGLMSVSHPKFSLAENLNLHRYIHEEAKKQFSGFIVYGEAQSEEKILILLNSSSKHDNHLYGFMDINAHQINKVGFCYGLRTEPSAKFILPSDNYVDGKDIPAYNGSEDVFNAWADNIYPGFKVKGYFPRDVLYVTKKLREHGVK